MLLPAGETLKGKEQRQGGSAGYTQASPILADRREHRV
jgi:hypothetical protein